MDSSGKVVRFPPLFDNGRSLNTDRADGSSCTLSGSFTKLVTVFGYPIRPAFTFNKEKVIGALSTFEGVYEFEQLKNRLAEYGEIWDETKGMHVF